jgi:hypothetical protein
MRELKLLQIPTKARCSDQSKMRTLWLLPPLLCLLITPTRGFAAHCPERTYNEAIALRDGRVLVVGYQAACIYDRRTRTWTSTGPLETPRREGRLAVLADGRVLLAGGHTDQLGILEYEPATKAEIFSPTTGQWIDAGELSDTPRNGHAVIAFADGKALVLGQDLQRVGEVFDPLLQRWRPSDHAAGNRFQTATLLDGRRVLLTGGEVQELTAMNWYDHPPTTQSNRTRVIELAPVQDEAILSADVTAGPNRAGVSNLLRSLLMEIDHVAVHSQNGPQLFERRSGHAAALLGDGSVLITGGITSEVDEDVRTASDAWFRRSRPRSTRSAERWLPAENRMEQLPPTAVARAYHGMLGLADGRVFVFGGYQESTRNPYRIAKSFEAYDPMRRRWRTLGALTQSHVFTSAVALPDGSLLVAGVGSFPEIYIVPRQD